MTDKDGGLLGLGANLIGDTLGMGGTTRDPAEPGRYMGDIPDYIMREVVNQRKSAMANAHQTAQIHPPPPLTKPPGYYLTSDEGSPCEPIEDYDLAPFKWKQQGIDTDELKKQCEDIERGGS